MAKKSVSDDFVDRALVAKRESKYIEFKEEFDPVSAGDWCEVVKDVVAIANSGGGCLVFGVDNHGKPVKSDLTALSKVDQAQIIDKVAKYTGAQLSDVQFVPAKKSSAHVIIWRIPGSDVPLVFANPGTYADGASKQKTAFARGTVYFRHGAKSEPAIQQDIYEVIERRLERVRAEWLKGLRKVVEAPEGYNVHMLPPEVMVTDQPEGTAIRLTDDPSSPTFFKLTPDKSHPFRQKELILEVNRRLPKGVQVNQYDIQAARKVFDVDTNATFTYRPKFATTQFSPALVDWLVRHYEKDNHFFDETRSKFYAKKHQGG